jgi:hypothetical protein
MLHTNESVEHFLGRVLRGEKAEEYDLPISVHHN